MTLLHLKLLSVVILYGNFKDEALSCIKCYRCESKTHLHCSERFDHENANLQPESCSDVFEAQYCIKATGMFEGEIGTKRFCSSRDHGDYCEYVQRPGDEREYRSCIYTCSTDGCNSAISWRLSLLLMLSAIILNMWQWGESPFH
ncbi:uncharacterized protein LOC111640387 [Centruroides sculpturatus]|uniref:uncharacterized protein LOC111640387 n=1 Tax=Centruroides sculpturatus TaxID=218467 RepID=UPI000C6E520B|nr:uncharacterized protein LOC111640387 [Centruroides sculpturatus]